MVNLSADSINPEILRKTAGNKNYDSGVLLVRWGRVEIKELGAHFAICEVRNYRIYQVRLNLHMNELRFNCDCSYGLRGGFCEHSVAAVLAIQKELQKRQPGEWRQLLNRLIQSRPVIKDRRVNRYILFFSLQENFIGNSSSWKIIPYALPYSAIQTQWADPEQVPDVEAIQNFFQNDPDLVYRLKTSYTTLNFEGCLNCEQQSVLLANTIIERTRNYSIYYTNYPLNEYLTYLANTESPLFLGSQTEPVMRRLKVNRGIVEMHLNLRRESEGIRLQLRMMKEGVAFDSSGSKNPAKVILSKPTWVLDQGTLYRVQGIEDDDLLQAILKQREFLIPSEEESEFLEKYYLPLAEKVPLQGDGVTWETIEAKPVSRLYLSESNGELQAQLRFGYGPAEVDYSPRLPGESVIHKGDSWTLLKVIRAPEFEEQAYYLASSKDYGLKRSTNAQQPNILTLRARIHPVEFLLHKAPHLIQQGFELFGEESLKTLRVNRNPPTLSFHISTEIDWFEIHTDVTFGDQKVSLKELRRLLRKKQRFVKLADGSVGEIPLVWIERYKHLFGLSEISGDNLRMAHTQMSLLDQLFSESQAVQVDAEFKRRREHLRNFSHIEPTSLPQGFVGELRPYQKAGYDWLHFLHEYNFGGCLADDMGLGKTIQALVYFQSLKEGISSKSNKNGSLGKETSKKVILVVVPRSLLVNWQREAARFTPGLKFLEYFDSHRTKDVQQFDQYDVIITTYGIMLRDIDLLRKYRFHQIVLDESQAIKNPLSQTAKAARLLQADHRLALTGTPVENSTMELWSLFSFLNPGLLGNLEYFKSEFSNPIERKSSEDAAQLLRKMVYPFILRRNKSQVAPELPPRSERILYCDMEPNQRKLYIRTRDTYRGVLLGLIEQEGVNDSRMKILEGLLRLRQITNHPVLMDEKFKGDSGKFDLLIETLTTLRAEGHKVLVFSQFVKMLNLVRKALDLHSIPYAYLDGSTTNRQEQVDWFQNDPHVPFFLISLRAGGIGLNLTAADYVIHIDPWWNPAVEMQATDRTHRIGQDKPVFVYKMIARDSVEEKILLLQDRKRELVEQLISTETSFLKDLTAEDVRLLFS